MNPMVEIIALHGFLGLPSDWDLVADSVAGLFAIRAENLAADADMLFSVSEPSEAFTAWVHGFTHKLEERREGATRPVLMGYSMGGRLAMHAAIARPDLFSAAIFISAHPGLASEEERRARRASDATWAERFRSGSEPWGRLLADWNTQGIFQGSTNLQRRESDFDRVSLARMMDLWSLGRQRDLRAELRTLPFPVLFLSGGRDAKFTALLSEFDPGARHMRRVLPGAGHRLPWDDSAGFRAVVEDFLKNHVFSSDAVLGSSSEFC